jgi:drug/metabolite transporter (DMT)-like permease
MHTWRVLIAILLGIAGVAAVALGVMYAVIPAHSLPSFIPGATTHAHKHLQAKHTRRGYAGIGVGVVLLILCLIVAKTGRRRRSSW